MADRDVAPDSGLLTQIFTTNEPETVSIILQDWDKCVFKAEFPRDARRSACVVRLESENENTGTFTTIATLQQLAATVIPGLVPQNLQVGKAKNLQERMFDFSVIEFVDGELLEDVWHQLDAENQSSIAAEIAEALKRLHSVRPRDEKIKEILGTLRDGDKILERVEQPGVFGGPHTGFLDDGNALLDSLLESRKLKKLFCAMEPEVHSQGVRIRSSFEELGSVFIPHSDIDKWSEEAVFCHNDLSPQNLILRSCAFPDTKPKYKLAGIIDWELAGFYPASYELSLQDTYLSSNNRHASFYLLLKENMKRSAPRSSSQVLLLQAMEVIFESQQRVFTDGTNIPAHIRKRFIKALKLIRDDDPYAGWVRNLQEEPVPDLSMAAFQKLEDDVVGEMIARRRSAANANAGAKVPS